MRKKLFLLLIFTLCLFWKSDVFALQINSNNVEIYALSEIYNNRLTMPGDLPTSFQLNVNGATNVRYRIEEGGDYIDVSNDGLITPSPDVYYCNSEDICKTYEQSGYNKVNMYRNGTAKIKVTADNEEFIVNVKLTTYESIRTDEIIDDYIAKNITASMTETQKVDKVMEFIRNTNYSVGSSSATGLVVGSGADCIGTASAILKFLEKLGIEGHMRYANRDTGAGSNHHNVAALIDGKVRILDAVSTKSPRTTMNNITFDGFSLPGGNYFSSDDPFIQYDGYDEVVYIPTDSTFKKLGNHAFYYGKHSKTKVREVHMGSNITEIGDGSFSRVNTLKSIIVDGGNPSFISIDGVLYSKDLKTLYAYPSGKEGSSLNIKNGIEELSNYAVSYNENLKSVVLPNGLKKIGDYALAGNKLTSINIPSTVTEIGAKAFSRNQIKGVVIPSSVTKLGNDAFDWDSGLYWDDQISYIVASNPNMEIDGMFCNFATAVYGYSGSTAEEAANKKNCPFIPITSVQSNYKDVRDLDVTIDEVPIKGDVTIPDNVVIKDGDYTLKENVDYKISYKYNDRVTKYAAADIVGIGRYAGYRQDRYSIIEKEIHYTFTNPKVTYNGEAQSPIVTTEEDDVEVLYGESKNSGGKTATPPQFKDAGVHQFGVEIKGKNYKTVYVDLEFEIKALDFTKAEIEPFPNFAYIGTSNYISDYTAFAVTYNGEKLTYRKDYIIEAPYYVSTVGTVSVFFKGIGNYSGFLEPSYKVLDNKSYTLNFSKKDITIGKGSTTKVSLYTNPDLVLDTSKISYSSSDVNVATIDKDGNIVGVGLGTATIKARFMNQEISTTVTVSDYLKGDMDGNGGIEIYDIMEVLYIISGKKEKTPTSIKIGDMTGDKDLDIFDVMELLYIYTGKK